MQSPREISRAILKVLHSSIAVTRSLQNLLDAFTDGGKGQLLNYAPNTLFIRKYFLLSRILYEVGVRKTK